MKHISPIFNAHFRHFRRSCPVLNSFSQFFLQIYFFGTKFRVMATFMHTKRDSQSLELKLFIDHLVRLLLYEKPVWILDWIVPFDREYICRCYSDLVRPRVRPLCTYNYRPYTLVPNPAKQKDSSRWKCQQFPPSRALLQIYPRFHRQQRLRIYIYLCTNVCIV